MEYELVNNVFIDGEVRNAGSVAKLDDATAKPLLERGSIRKYVAVDPNAEPVVPAPALVDGNVVEGSEFTVDGAVFAKVQTATDGVVCVRDGVLTTEADYDIRRQEFIQAKIDAERAIDETTPVVPEATDNGLPLDTVGIQNQGIQPTPEQIAIDAATAGSVGSETV